VFFEVRNEFLSSTNACFGFIGLKQSGIFYLEIRECLLQFSSEFSCQDHFVRHLKAYKVYKDARMFESNVFGRRWK
jgi:hypothetical protein